MSHCLLAARMIWRNVFGRTSILGGWWFGVVWTRWSFIFLKHPFCQASVLLFIFLIKNHPGAKSVVEWIPSPKQPRRPLSSLLSVSSSLPKSHSRCHCGQLLFPNLWKCYFVFNNLTFFHPRPILPSQLGSSTQRWELAYPPPNTHIQ